MKFLIGSVIKRGAELMVIVTLARNDIHTQYTKVRVFQCTPINCNCNYERKPAAAYLLHYVTVREMLDDGEK